MDYGFYLMFALFGLAMVTTSFMFNKMMKE
jgi:hypothetical protein